MGWLIVAMTPAFISTLMTSFAFTAIYPFRLGLRDRHHRPRRLQQGDEGEAGEVGPERHADRSASRSRARGRRARGAGTGT